MTKLQVFKAIFPNYFEGGIWNPDQDCFKCFKIVGFKKERSKSPELNLPGLNGMDLLGMYP